MNIIGKTSLKYSFCIHLVEVLGESAKPEKESSQDIKFNIHCSRAVFIIFYFLFLFDHLYSRVLPIIYSFVLLWTCVAELFFVKTSHFSRNSLLVWADHPPAPLLSSLVMFVMTQYCCNQKLNAAAQIFAMSSHSRQLLFKDLVGGRYKQNLSNKGGIVI